MNLVLRKILLSCCCLFFAAGTFGQTKFYALLSTEAISIDEYVTYRVVIENAPNVQSVTPPSFKDFIVVSGPSQETGMSSVNGYTTRYISLVYNLQPKRLGTMTIGPAFTSVSGKRLRSNVVSVRISNRKSGSAGQSGNFDPFAPSVSKPDFNDYILHKGDDVDEKLKRNMILKLVVDKTTCFVGEPIIAEYKLYARLKGESKLVQNPSFNGFSVVEMQPQDISAYGKEKLDGREYNVYTIRKAQLYALQPGLISLEPAELENNVQFLKEEYAKKLQASTGLSGDVLDGFLPPEAVIVRVINLKSNPVNITVKPLPIDNKPEGFKGAVGKFSIIATLQKPLFSTDEAGKLSVTITGSGNMRMLTSPDIEWPAKIESFEPKFSESLDKSTVPISGSKIFEFNFAAIDSGHFILPAIRLSYFDVSEHAYKTIYTEPIQFQVTKGSGQFKSALLKLNDPEKPSILNSLFDNRGWLILIIVCLLMLALAGWFKFFRKQAEPDAEIPLALQEENEKLDQIAEASMMNQVNVFQASETCLYEEDCVEFYQLLNAELKQYLALKFSLDQHTIDSTSIITILDYKAMPNALVLKLQQLMQEIEWQLYTPFEKNGRMNFLYQEAHELVQLINSHYATRL